MSKLLKPTNDYVFGRIFGENKDSDILKDLLEAILPDIKIEHIQIRKQVQLNKKLLKNKLSTLDITATLNTGIIVNIEMQMSDKHNTVDRSIFYASGLYHDSLMKKQDYTNIPRTICIWILNYNLFNMGPFHERARIKRDYDNIVLTDKVEYHYIQLPKFKQKCERISSKLEQWLTFIINENLEEINKMDNKYIRQAKEKLDYINNDENERLIAEYIEKGIRDEEAAIAGARSRGLAEGLEKGLAEGRSKGLSEGKNEERMQIAKKMLDENIDIHMIVKVTGLTKEEIEKL